MRAYEKEPANKVFGEPEIVELGIDDDGKRQWYMATREGFQEVGENGVLMLDMQHFTVGTRITLQEPLEDESPCPVCGNEERDQGGYLSCECPAPHDCGEDTCVCAEPTED